MIMPDEWNALCDMAMRGLTWEAPPEDGGITKALVQMARDNAIAECEEARPEGGAIEQVPVAWRCRSGGGNNRSGEWLYRDAGYAGKAKMEPLYARPLTPEGGRSIIDPDVIKQARAVVDRYNKLIGELDYSAEFLEREVAFAEPLVTLYDACNGKPQPQ